MPSSPTCFYFATENANFCLRAVEKCCYSIAGRLRWRVISDRARIYRVPSGSQCISAQVCFIISRLAAITYKWIRLLCSEKRYRVGRVWGGPSAPPRSRRAESRGAAFVGLLSSHSTPEISSQVSACPFGRRGSRRVTSFMGKAEGIKGLGTLFYTITEPLETHWDDYSWTSAFSNNDIVTLFF